MDCGFEKFSGKLVPMRSDMVGRSAIGRWHLHTAYLVHNGK